MSSIGWKKIEVKVAIKVKKDVVSWSFLTTYPSLYFNELHCRYFTHNNNLSYYLTTPVTPLAWHYFIGYCCMSIRDFMVTKSICSTEIGHEEKIAKNDTSNRHSNTLTLKYTSTTDSRFDWIPGRPRAGKDVWSNTMYTLKSDSLWAHLCQLQGGLLCICPLFVHLFRFDKRSDSTKIHLWT